MKRVAWEVWRRYRDGEWQRSGYFLRKADAMKGRKELLSWKAIRDACTAVVVVRVERTRVREGRAKR